jgi:hypothetical protein
LLWTICHPSIVNDAPYKLPGNGVMGHNGSKLLKTRLRRQLKVCPSTWYPIDRDAAP